MIKLVFSFIFLVYFIEQTTTTGEPIYSKLVKKPKDPESGTDPGQYVPLPDGENID